jgi:hypothetical protein
LIFCRTLYRQGSNHQVVYFSVIVLIDFQWKPSSKPSVTMILFHSRALLLAGFLSLIATACGMEEPSVSQIHTADLPQIETDHQLTITDTDDLYFQQITDIASDSEGRIYLVDQRALRIHLFDAAGEYLTSIGGEGAGPGEFQIITGAFVDSQDRLFVYDVQNNRNSIFRNSGGKWELDRVFATDGNMYSVVTADDSDNVILRSSIQERPEPGAFWYRHELATGNLDTGVKEEKEIIIRDMGFLVNESMNMQIIPFGRTTLLAPGPDGNIHVVWNEDVEIVTYNTELEPVDSLSVTVPNQPVRADERNRALDRLGENFRSAGREHIPDTKPAVSDMLVDRRGNFWLRTFDSPVFLVLDSEGEPLGSFDLPEGLRIAHVDDNRLYAVKMGDQGYEIHLFGYEI